MGFVKTKFLRVVFRNDVERAGAINDEIDGLKSAGVIILSDRDYEFCVNNSERVESTATVRQHEGSIAFLDDVRVTWADVRIKF